jgi:protoporphyrinogen oxidase
MVLSTKTIIVGAGIAGLWIADKLATNTDDDITILEMGDYAGGRVITSKKYGYEIGAGRIDLRDHKHVMALVKRFGLKSYEHGKGSLWLSVDSGQEKPTTDPFHAIWNPVIAILKKLDPTVLATHTLRELATRVLGPKQTDALLIQFPYRAELDTLRADLAIHSFETEMNDTSTFGSVVGGLSTIIHGLESDVKKKGVQIQFGVTVTDVLCSGFTYTVLLKEGKPMKADRVILALPSVALRSLPVLHSFQPLKHLTMKPLTRIYAKTVGPWPFQKRIVTESPLRYIIPIQPAEGIVMISYTESQDTRRFLGLKGPTLIAALLSELNRLFPSLDLDMEWAHAYEWSDGCTYWTPGLVSYDPVEEGRQALQPFPSTMPHLHLVGESFSQRQAWMEGALEHAAELWSVLSKTTSANPPV